MLNGHKSGDSHQYVMHINLYLIIKGFDHSNNMNACGMHSLPCVYSITWFAPPNIIEALYNIIKVKELMIICIPKFYVNCKHNIHDIM